MTEEAEAEIGEVSQYPYSVKITQTALGARISVHAYDHDLDMAISHAIFLYEKTREDLTATGFKIAPEEPSLKNKKEN